MFRTILQRKKLYPKQNFTIKPLITPFNLKSSNQYHTANDTFFVDSSGNVKIEVIHYSPAKQTKFPPILFIHGGFLAAWSWDNFSHWFSSKGYDCYALSFRGNGKSTKIPKRDKWWTLNECTDDLSAVTDAITAKTKDKPILVGYLQDNHQKVSGGALLASASPYIYKTIFSQKPSFLFLKSLITLDPYVMVETPELMKKALFSSAFPDSMAREVHPKLEKTCSLSVLFKFLTHYVDPSKIKCPMIVLGGGEDIGLSDNVKAAKETAKAYGVEADIIEGSGHEMMLDVKWEETAKVVIDRIQERILNKK